jgi:hypothetical protein
MGKRVNLMGMRVGRLLIKESVKCGRVIKWKCLCDCGKETLVITNSLLHSKTKSCGCYNSEVARDRNTGDKGNFWKGGKGTVSSRGYIVIKHGDNRGKLLHRVIYEEHYGVKLTSKQNLHHINGDRLDNRIENLELWDCSQPYGQRVEDKINYYFNLVEKYKNHPEYIHLFPPTL